VFSDARLTQGGYGFLPQGVSAQTEVGHFRKSEVLGVGATCRSCATRSSAHRGTVQVADGQQCGQINPISPWYLSASQKTLLAARPLFASAISKVLHLLLGVILVGTGYLAIAWSVQAEIAAASDEATSQHPGDKVQALMSTSASP
jgi:hypothetical protein